MPPSCNHSVRSGVHLLIALLLVGDRMLHRLAVATIVTAAIAVVPASSGQATAPPSGLRLITGFHHVDVSRFGEEPELFFPVAVYVAPTGGAFQVEAVRHAGGGIAYWQTRPGSGDQARVRQIYPPRSARIDAGLPDFFVFTLRTA